MLAHTHVMGGIAAGLGAATLVPVDPILLTATSAFGALVPDICHTGSTIGKRAPVVSKIVSVIFGHRTMTHSLLFLLLVAYGFTFSAFPLAIEIGFVVGMASHLLLDACTKRGIKLLYPLPFTFRLLSIRTGGPFEPLVFAALAVLSLYWGLNLLGI